MAFSLHQMFNMKTAFFDTHKYERPYFERASIEFNSEITYFEARLTIETIKLARGFDVVCVFVNDIINEDIVLKLKEYGIGLIVLRSAGFNNVDIAAAHRQGIKVARVPEYSPYAVAEHATALILALNRKVHRAFNRVREHNFSLEGLVGFDLHDKTVGIIGVGKIGEVMAKIMRGFGCEVLLYDKRPKPQLEALGLVYAPFEDLLKKSDIISLHLPLTSETHHIIDAEALKKMRPGCMLINTGRGGLINSKDLLNALKVGRLGHAGLDVYEEEENIFFRDLSEYALKDDCLARLITFPNVLITSHQAFLTEEALSNIAQTTMKNILAFEEGNDQGRDSFIELP